VERHPNRVQENRTEALEGVSMAQVHPIPTLPAVHAQALGLLGDSKTSIPELGDIVETDPALTVSVLRAANSAASAPVTPIGTPGEAIVRVGLETTRKIVTAAVVSESFNRLDHAGLDTTELWRHLFTTALVADASAWGAQQRSTAFTAGLLHLIGRMAMAQSDPQRYQRVVEMAASGVQVLDAEVNVFGYDSQSWGVEVARAWDVPDEIVEAVGGFSDGSIGPLAWVTWNGRRISSALGIGDGVQPAEQMDIHGPLTEEDERLLSGFGGAEGLIEQANWMLQSVTSAQKAA
jgi:HD-like signal output (HDOD) protein